MNRRIYGMLYHVDRSPEAYSTYFEILLQYIGPGTNTHFPIYRHFWLHTKIDKKISDPRRGMRFAPYYAAPQCASFGFCPNWLGAIASAQSRLDRNSMSFFGMTPHMKNIFFKINPLTYEDAVFTIRCKIHWRLFLALEFI